MSKNKQSFLYLMEIMKETDENHPITAVKIAEIMDKEYNMPLERRSIGRDLRLLRDNGIDIIFCPDNKQGCYLGTREFEDWELKVLIDAVNQAKFLKKGISDSIVERLLKLTSANNREFIKGATPVRTQIKTKNKTTQNNIDTLLGAISACKKVSFEYCSMDGSLTLVPRKGGKRYVVNPYSLIWNNDIYYLICNYTGFGGLSYYRLDKIKSINILKEAVVTPKELLGVTYKEKISDFIEGSIHSYGGENKIHLRLQVPEIMLDHLYDEFGDGLIMANQDKESGEYIVVINTSENQGLYYLLLQYGPSIKVMGPENIKNEYINKLKTILNKY